MLGADRETCRRLGHLLSSEVFVQVHQKACVMQTYMLWEKAKTTKKRASAQRLVGGDNTKMMDGLVVMLTNENC